MRKPKKSPANTRKKQGGFRPFLYLVLTIALIILLFFLLEKQKKPAPAKPEGKPPVERPAPQVERPGKPVPPSKPEISPEPEKAVKPEKPVKPAPVHKGYTAPVPVVKPPVAAGEGTIAIIIDDIGSSLKEARDLMDIGVPLTFSVIPGLRQAREVAETVHAGGYDVMLHIPMEPQDYPARRLESNGLLLAYPEGEIEKRMKGYFQTVPHAVGANNHMGSRFTEDRDKMRVVLEMLREKRMFFVDSMTTPKSVGVPLSRELGLHAAARSAPFLDNCQDVAAVKAQLGALERLARKRGSAVGICHPHRATIQALTEELPQMRSRGIRFVYVSRLVR